MTGLEERVRHLEDRAAIQELRAHYCHVLDDGDWDGVVDCFTPDGVFEGLGVASGAAQLRSFFGGLQDGPLTSWWHFSCNETVELDRDTATGTTWLLQPCVVEGEAQVAAGRYVDSMVRCPDGRWRFQKRHVTFFWWADLQNGWDAGRFAWPGAAAAADRSVRVDD